MLGLITGILQLFMWNSFLSPVQSWAAHRQFVVNFYVHMCHSSRSIKWHYGSTLPYYDCCNFVSICLFYRNCVLFNKINMLNYFYQFAMFEKLGDCGFL